MSATSASLANRGSNAFSPVGVSRSFLLLQGTASMFFQRLESALTASGYSALRVNFCGGDRLYGKSRSSLDYRGKFEELPGWYASIIRDRGITDVVMFGDCREPHRHMHSVAERLGVKVHVFEEGYVRPYWITLERHGVNARSRLPRSPRAYMRGHASLPSMPSVRETGYNLYERAFHDIVYRVANAALAWRYPRFRSHRPRNGFVEYAGLALRALLGVRYRREAEVLTVELLETRRSFYLYPLQLSSDAQIVVHSPYVSLGEAIDQVVLSFARYAPGDAWLILKNHPLDTGVIDHRRHALAAASRCGVADRVRFVDAGHLPTLLSAARGVIVVNSTVGVSALHHCRPLIALGTAIYDLPGLTWQGELDDFWLGGTSPDMHLYQAFLDYVLHHTQINGDFYTRKGIAMAVAGAVERLGGADA